MRNLLGSCLLLGLLACSSAGTTDNETCPSYASAGGNRNTEPSYDWDQVKCACSPTNVDASAGSTSCSGPQVCAKVCCTCPGSSGWTFSARVCRNNTCLDQAAACPVVLEATGDPCRARTPQG